MTTNAPDPELAETPDAAEAAGEEKWQRLSPVASLYYLIKIANVMINHALPSLAPLVVVILSSENKATMAIASISGLAVVIMLAAFLQYLFFRYRLADNEILVNQGVLKRQHRVVNFDRIQNININQPIYFRPFKLVTLVIDTAGSKGGEGDLAGIPETTAKQIRDKILQRQNQLKAEQPELAEAAQEQAQAPKDELLATASLGDIIRYGLSNNGMYILLAFMAPFYNRLDEFIGYWISEQELEALADMLGGRLIGGLILVLLLMLSVFLLLMLISIIGSIFKFHNYRLTLSGDTLKRKSGLVNTHEEALNLSKIQAIARQCNFIGKWLGRENLICRQTGTGVNKQQKRANLFIVPARTGDDCDKLTQILYPDCPQEIETLPISRRYILKTLVLKLLLPVMLFSSLIIYHEGWQFAALWLLPLLCYPLVVKRWRKYRYGQTDEYGLINSGFIGHKQVRFPLFKVQRAVISQSPIQKRRDLATLTIYLASGHLRIPYMPIEHANQWFDRIYAKIETDPRPWF